MRLDWRFPIFLAAALSGIFGSTGFGDANAPFTTEDPVTAVTNVGGVPAPMHLDSGHRPVFLYFKDDSGSSTTGGLWLYRCADMNCTSGSNTNIVASGLSNQIALGLAIDANDRPVIVYRVPSTSVIHVIRCAQADCAGSKPDFTITGSVSSTRVVIDVELAGDLPAMILNVSGSTNFVRCLLPDCSTGTTAHPLPLSGSSFEQLEFTSAGLPVIALQTFIPPNDGFQLVRCNDPVCAAGGDATKELDGDSNFGYWGSLILDANDRPFAAYGNNAGNTVKLAICADAACTGTPTLRTIASGTLLFDTSIALKGGVPLVVFKRNLVSASGTSLVRCSSASCATFTTSDVDGPYSGSNNGTGFPTLVFDPSDGYFIGYHHRGGQSIRLQRASSTAFEATPGDVDCTGTWEAQDALIIMRHLAGVPGAPQPVAPCATDVDGTPGTTIGDVIFARRKAAGL